MTILVTGGAGYIGTHTVVELVKKDCNVIIVDNFSNSDPLILNRLNILCKTISSKTIKIYNRDCRDDLSDILSTNKVDGVIHFAALKSVSDSVSNPIEYYDNNINSLLSLLRQCEKFDIKKFVFSSSCSLYGNVDKLPVDELTNISEAESPYAYTKLVGERIIQDFCKVNNISAISLRYFNPVGAHESGLIGEYKSLKSNNIVPVICESINGDEMCVYGNDYETRDGTCIRDYVHVSDIANAHVLALDYMDSMIGYDVFNLGSENGVSVLELINIFESQNNVKVNYKIGNKRCGDVVQIYSNSEKARKLLGWVPVYNVNDMVSSAWRWYNNI